MRRCPDCQQPTTSSGFCGVCARERADLDADRNAEWWAA